MKQNKLYKIYWYDIEHENEWTPIERPFEIPELMCNVWFYWGEKGNFYFFGSGWSKHSHFERVAVPKACVKKIEKI